MLHPYHTTVILFPTLCILISLVIMLTLHHRALTRLFRRIFQRRRNRNYRRINNADRGGETGLAINPRTWEYWAAEYDIYMWTRDDDDDDDDYDGGEDGEGRREMEDMEVLWGDSDSSTHSESESESGSESRFWSEREENRSQLIFSSDQQEYTRNPDGNESPVLSDGSVCGSPLGKYFDPSTSLLLEEVLEPATPVVGNWERRMEVRIREGRGLRAWIDWAVDRVVGRVQRAVEER